MKIHSVLCILVSALKTFSLVPFQILLKTPLLENTDGFKHRGLKAKKKKGVVIEHCAQSFQGNPKESLKLVNVRQFTISELLSTVKSNLF